LAAPIGSPVQFRYDKVHIAEDTLATLTSKDTTFPIEGMVCSVATAGLGPLPIVPIRKVEIQKPREHGATLSIPLVMGDFALGKPTGFTADVDRLTNQNSPRRVKEGDEPIGFYCFTAETPKNVEIGRTIKIWEEVVKTLRDQHAYKEEPFFWVSVGVEREGEALDSNYIHPWPSALEPDKQHQLLIYHFQPKGGKRPDSKMEVIFGTALRSIVPPDTKIDSRYDLKSWRFGTTENPQRQLTTWVRIRTADIWDLDLTLTLKAAYSGWIIRSLIAGPLVATPAILALLPQEICLRTKLLLAAGAVLAGILASLASTFKIDKPKTS